MSGPAPQRPARVRLRAAIARLSGIAFDWATDPDRMARFLVSLGSATVLVITLLAYTHGGLLYSGDQVGTYSPGDFWLHPYPDFVIPSLAVGLSFDNPYAGFYWSLFFEAFACAYACQLFVRELFAGSLSRGELLGAQALAAPFYLFNPSALTSSFNGFTANVLLSNAALFLVLLGLLRLARRLRSGSEYRARDALLLGLAVGLSVNNFPNNLRILGLETVALIGVLVGSYLLRAPTFSGTRFRQAVARLVVISLPTALLLLAYDIYQFVTTWLLPNGAIATVASSFGIGVPNGSFDPLSDVLRLVGRRSFHSQFIIYSGAYFSNPGIVLVSFLWPLFALPIPLLLTRDRNQGWILTLVATSVVCLAWDTGPNPPFGSVNAAIIRALPFGSTLLPQYFLTLVLVGKLYAVLAAFSVIELSRWAATRGVRVPTAARAGAPSIAPAAVGPPVPVRGSIPRSRNPVAVGLAVGLAAVVLFASWPVFDGSVESVYFDPALKGFFVPHDYAASRQLILNSGTTALLLPSVRIYLSTEWGYHGAGAFYLDYYYPARVIVPGYWGAYSIYFPNIQAQYAAVTQPLGPGPNVTPVNVAWAAESNPLGNGWAQYSYKTAPAVNVSQFRWLTIAWPVSNSTEVANLVAASDLWIGVRTSTSRGTGWFDLGAGVGSSVTTVSGGILKTSVLLATPTGASGQGNVSGGLLASLIVFVRQNLSGSNFTVGSPVVFGVRGSQILPSWLSLARSFGVGYVLVDRSIIEGAAEGYAYVNACVQALGADHVATSALSGPTLDLYRIA